MKIKKCIVSFILIMMFFIIKGNYYEGDFQPHFISGCTFWIDAADQRSITFRTGTDYIQQIDDKSGNDNHASQALQDRQVTYLYGYINNKNVFKCEYRKYLTARAGTFPAANQQYDVFLVLKANYSSSTNMAFLYTGLSVTNQLFYIWFYQNKFHTDWYANEFQAGNITSNTWYILNTDYDQAGRDHYINNVFQGSDSETSKNISSQIMYIGYDLFSVGLEVYFGEIIIYDRKLNKYEKDQISTYLSKKWGI